jgi:hypothetical protein
MLGILVSPSIIDVYAEALTASTDKSTYSFGSTVNVSGKVPLFVEGETGTIKVYTPKNQVFLDGKFTPDANASYTYSFTLEGNILQEGSWVIRIGYHGNTKIISIEVTSEVEKQGGTETPASLTASTDRKEYLLEETITITGKASPVSDKSVIVQIFNPSNMAISFAQIQPSKDGSFQHSFPLKGNLAIAGNYTINITYSGKSVTMSVYVIEPPQNEAEEEPMEKITAAGLSFVDATGSIKESVSAGEQILIQTRLTNNQREEQDFVYLVQVKDIDGVTVMISWIKSSINPGQIVSVAQSWLPEEGGNYNIEAFVWEDISNPIPLINDVLELSVTVNE